MLIRISGILSPFLGIKHAARAVRGFCLSLQCCPSILAVAESCDVGAPVLSPPVLRPAASMVVIRASCPLPQAGVDSSWLIPARLVCREKHNSNMVVVGDGGSVSSLEWVQSPLPSLSTTDRIRPVCHRPGFSVWAGQSSVYAFSNGPQMCPPAVRASRWNTGFCPERRAVVAADVAAGVAFWHFSQNTEEIYLLLLTLTRVWSGAASILASPPSNPAFPHTRKGTDATWRLPSGGSLRSVPIFTTVRSGSVTCHHGPCPGHRTGGH